jgi:hypothetical protein
VALVRDVSFQRLNAEDLRHTGYLLVFALAMWRLAISQLGKHFID